MKYTIDENVVKEKGLSLCKLLAILLVKDGADVKYIFDDLVGEGILVKIDGKYLVTQRWDDVSSDILLTSEQTGEEPDKLESLAIKMMAIFPQTKMPGQPYYYKCNKKEVALKLRKFFKIYGRYSDEDILKATERYVNSFHGDYKYMKLLKYFIMKNEKTRDIEGKESNEATSQLATELENTDSTEYSANCFSLEGFLQ